MPHYKLKTQDTRDVMIRTLVAKKTSETKVVLDVAPHEALEKNQELLKFLEPLEQSLLKGGVSPTLSFKLNLLELLDLLRLIPLILLFKLMFNS